MLNKVYFTCVLAGLNFLVAGAGADNLHGDLIDLGPHRAVWVEHRPASPGRPTLLLLNGLNDGTGSWVKFTRAIVKIDPGLGIVRYNPRGVPLSDQVADLRDLKSALHLTGPVFAVGLSYGGALAIEYLARYPDELEAVIAFSPYLAVLPGSEKLVEHFKSTWRTLVPRWIISDDALESGIFRGVLVGCCFASEPLSLNGLTELCEIARRADGVRRWSLLERAKDLPPGKLHLSFSREDPVVTLAQVEPILAALPKGAASSVTVWNNSYHRLVEQRPRLSAAYVYRVMSRHPALGAGRRFVIEPREERAVSGDFTVFLNRESLCADALTKYSAGG